MPLTLEHGLSAGMKECLQNCTECHNICAQTTVYCIEMGGKHAQSAHLESLLDCATVCRISADFLLRGSSLHPQICGVCAQACQTCVESCAQFPEDAQMRACAEECRRCAETCREMSKVRVQ